MVGSFLLQTAVFLAAAVIAAPFGRWLKVGPVIAYLGAGVLIGPFGIGFVYAVYEVDKILHIAELGVVLLLFVIGLELRLPRLWAMRRSIFGAGAAQLLLTGLVLAVAGRVFGLGLVAAAVLGLALAMSSTAFSLQVLEEKGELQHRHGRLAFSILLFQDLAAIPLLAVVPLLAARGATDAATAAFAVARAMGVIAVVVVLGHYVLTPVYRLVARSGVREAMTASALLTVVGVALLMQWVGLSAALGAFIAGAMLADSEYRHQMEADIAPFQGLLLGLFFMAIGMTLDLGLLARALPAILLVVAGLLAVKGAVLYAVGRWQGLDDGAARRLAIFVSQGGEFAFVVMTLATGTELISRGLAGRLAIAVTLSMMATPLLLMADDILRRRRPVPMMAFDAMPESSGHVVIVGFGRVGQIVARILRAKRLPFTALDISPDQVDLVRKFGNEAYFGDATRLDILEAARTSSARAFVLAIDDVETSLKVAGLVRRHFPGVPIYARARNRQHVYRLLDLGVARTRRETFLSSIELTRDVLAGLGLSNSEIRRLVDAFIEQDRKHLYEDYKLGSDIDKRQARSQARAVELEGLLAQDEADRPKEAAEAPRHSD